ncbi:hypothetical protein D9613_009492 [Agrocybe pediades]|uniref:Extracellular membrane protein CFEM domain-containing protein n=1 Tax=Agrocybe pediades TaxID=84607 RepID=A0A8H4R464_9AGAR|nr:hypothetical protein D9613_009492 [Agrocybe pediades]
MRTILFFFAVSLVLASGVSGGSTRHARLMMRQASTGNCDSTCNTFLQQSCTTSDCLCTSANQASLQACLNCLGSDTTSPLAANVDGAAAAFNGQCQGTATVSASVSLPSGDSDDDSGDNQTGAPPSEATGTPDAGSSPAVGTDSASPTDSASATSFATSAPAAGPTDAPGQGGAGVSITGSAFTLPGSAVMISPSVTPGAAFTLPGSAVMISSSSTASAAATQASDKSPSGAVLTMKNGRTILLASLSLILPVLVF